MLSPIRFLLVEILLPSGVPQASSQKGKLLQAVHRIIYSKLRYLLNLVKGIIKFTGLLRKAKSTRTSIDSREEYDLLDNREQVAYETGSRTVMVNGVFQKMPVKESRQIYLSHLYNYLDQVIEDSSGRPIRVLEVGCGNCINVINLIEKYGDALEITGMDISDERIKVAKAHYGEMLDGVEFSVASITEGLDYRDNVFDVVFSMHCLEQIAYETRDAVREMYRLASKFVVMIEPVFENGNAVQRLYLISVDYCRILLKCVEQLGYKTVENRSLEVQVSPSNQSTLLVLEKEKPD